MIFVIEQDIRPYNKRRFTWKPGFFRGRWRSWQTWRIVWGFWSVSYYPEQGLHDFFRHVESGQTEWRDK